MKLLLRWGSGLLILIFGLSSSALAAKFFPANDSCIKYFGRWDMADSLHPRHSWPGIFIETGFYGDSIGVRMNDTVNYYDVYIDGELRPVLHGNKAGDADYILADSLGSGRHLLRFSQRNISFGIYSFSGILLADSGSLCPPPAPPVRKIEFIGDSFTAAEGNEAKDSVMQWEAKFPVTDIDSGFAVMVAQHYNAQYHIIARSGIGTVCDWQGKFDISMQQYYDRTLMESSEPKWDFKRWTPDLVVVCLGLNDYSGLKEKSGKVSQENSLIFRRDYHKLLSLIRREYPGVSIIAVSPPVKWIERNVERVVNEEHSQKRHDIYFTHFDFYPGGYVANGHPSVSTHRKIADVIIKKIESSGLIR
ncbi:MAG TPA: GDSL-type esterase/lipase family protein [Candidatus Acidoferrales bacterium]|nr:GDSL-type esterase/lipase family protein [Candidatus Acidoferrales bacterium]